MHGAGRGDLVQQDGDGGIGDSAALSIASVADRRAPVEGSQTIEARSSVVRPGDPLAVSAAVARVINGSDDDFFAPVEISLRRREEGEVRLAGDSRGAGHAVSARALLELTQEEPAQIGRLVQVATSTSLEVSAENVYEAVPTREVPWVAATAPRVSSPSASANISGVPSDAPRTMSTPPSDRPDLPRSAVTGASASSSLAQALAALLRDPNSRLSTAAQASRPSQSMQAPGSSASRVDDSLLSRGSMDHEAGGCRPCIYTASGSPCRLGTDCEFCHLEHRVSHRQRPPKHVRWRIVQRLREAIPAEDNVPLPRKSLSESEAEVLHHLEGEVEKLLREAPT
mmetsp:Transcript_78553/g.163205  ORF Transcript_78553/g.163205 Transcript_78553/m.163205 type:complete len:341 (-) Transcript_78553:564-1586(-)